MSKTLKTMLAETPLVKNLENKEYLDTILDGKTTLAERFAEIDAKIVREELKKSMENPEKIPLKIKAIIRNPLLPVELENLFTRQLKNTKSN